MTLSAYDIEEVENEWVKGVSDYLMNIKLSGEKYLFVEIKLKAQEFRKTNGGGKTHNGSIIPNYGCTSYYLDVIPVYRNMNNFVNRTGIAPYSFMLAFAKNDLSEINVISLAKIRNIIDEGWKKGTGEIVNICKYGEGYGKVAYLIPKQGTTNIMDLTKKQVEKATVNAYPIP